MPPASRPKRETTLACNRLALSPELRARHFDVLGPALVKLRKGVRDLPDGYEFAYEWDPSTYAMLSEWVGQEHLCCPFFDIAVRVEHEDGRIRMELTGPSGTKDFVAQALNERSAVTDQR